MGTAGTVGGTPGHRAAAIILAGGSGTRIGAGQNKVYVPLAGSAVITWSLRTLGGLPEIEAVILVVRPQDREIAQQVLDQEVAEAVEIVDGGSTRQESELCGLRHLAARISDGSIDTVLVHDGARPLVGVELARAVLRAARKCGGAVPVIPRDDLALANAGGDRLIGPAPAGLVAVQTPQGFCAAPLLAACAEAERQGFTGTDTASCVERFSEVATRWVSGDERNFKVTYPYDLILAEQLLA
ncbi:MAG: IspD/TarI family cytidylyltransferase [Pseudonocardia sp.]